MADTNTKTSMPVINGYWLLAFTGLFCIYIPAIHLLYNVLLIDPYYSHGFVVPLVSLYFVFKFRHIAKIASKDHERHSVYPLMISLMVYCIAFLIDFRFLMYVTLVTSLGGLVYYIWGTGVLKVLFFPLSYLFLMLPLPYSFTSAIAFPLQLASSRYAALLLDLFGISALQEGVNIYIPGYSFVIEKGCSGLHSIVALFTLSVLFCYLLQCDLHKKIFLVFSSLPIALVSNLVRIVVVMLVAQIAGKDVAESFFHSFSSVFLFLVAFLLLIGTGRFIGCLRLKK